MPASTPIFFIPLRHKLVAAQGKSILRPPAKPLRSYACSKSRVKDFRPGDSFRDTQTGAQSLDVVGKRILKAPYLDREVNYSTT